MLGLVPLAEQERTQALQSSWLGLWRGEASSADESSPDVLTRDSFIQFGTCCEGRVIEFFVGFWSLRGTSADGQGQDFLRTASVLPDSAYAPRTWIRRAREVCGCLRTVRLKCSCLSVRLEIEHVFSVYRQDGRDAHGSVEVKATLALAWSELNTVWLP